MEKYLYGTILLHVSVRNLHGYSDIFSSQDENGALANFFPNTDFTFSQAGKSRPIDQALALFSYK